VSYSPVLQQALKFMVGLRSLRSASYDHYCFIRKLETGMMAQRIIRDAQKRKKEINVPVLLANKNKFNLIKAMLNIRLAFIMWKE
jgi:hypothetical protein